MGYSFENNHQAIEYLATHGSDVDRMYTEELFLWREFMTGVEVGTVIIK